MPPPRLTGSAPGAKIGIIIETSKENAQIISEAGERGASEKSI